MVALNHIIHRRTKAYLSDSALVELYSILYCSRSCFAAGSCRLTAQRSHMIGSLCPATDTSRNEILLERTERHFYLQDLAFLT